MLGCRKSSASATTSKATVLRTRRSGSTGPAETGHLTGMQSVGHAPSCIRTYPADTWQTTPEASTQKLRIPLTPGVAGIAVHANDVMLLVEVALVPGFGA